MIKILLCEQSNDWADKFQNSIPEDFNLLDVYDNGMDLQRGISEHSPDVVIINLETKRHSCLEVIKFIKQNSQRTTIILLINSKNVLDDYFYSEKDIKKLGISLYCVKPFPVIQIFKFITEKFHHTAWKNLEKNESDGGETEVTAPDHNFTSIDLLKFGFGNIAIFDIYIRLSKNKYLKYIHKGSEINTSELREYCEKKGISRLFFKSKDRLSYINFINEMIDTKVKDSKKIKLLEGASSVLIDEIYYNGIAESLVYEANQISQNIYNLIVKNHQLKNLTRSIFLDDSNDQERVHIFLTSFITAIISKETQWITSYTRDKLMFGAFLHDIGKIKLPKGLLSFKYEQMNDKQKNEYKKHCEYGVELLDNIPIINEQIKQIVYQHHELGNGEGYPLGLTGSKIYSLAKIVGFANYMAKRCLEKKKSPYDTMKELLEERSEIIKYDPDVVRAFIHGFIQK